MSSRPPPLPALSGASHRLEAGRSVAERGHTDSVHPDNFTTTLCFYIYPPEARLRGSLVAIWRLFLSESVRLRAGYKVREPRRMNPQCARCGKIVYPTEKVSCLDKVSGRTAVLLPARCSLSTPTEEERRRRAVNLVEAQVGVRGREREREREREPFL